MVVQYTWPMGCATIRRFGLVGVGVALLEWVWPCWRKCVTVEVGFEVSYMFKSVLPLLSVELSAPSLAPHLPERCRAFDRDNNGLDL